MKKKQDPQTKKKDTKKKNERKNKINKVERNWQNQNPPKNYFTFFIKLLLFFFFLCHLSKFVL